VDLIGREAELRLVAERLRDRRLVTLIGPGGIGKTTLARAAAAACADSFGEGARTVDLTRVDSPEGVAESLAGQLGYASFAALIDAPGDHSVLVVVDNCEHVVEAVSGAIDQLLAACRMPTVLATSRAALELPGEVVVPVGPLELPPLGTVDGPAVRLFLDRARDAGAQVEPSDTVAELCRRLDGVPLAIELAAARARAMAPAEILARLDAGLDVLDRPRRRSARRHQSLRAAIAWSHDLLDEDERDLFARLGAFSGPFTTELAHEVAAAPGTDVRATQDLIDGLVAASMVVADPSGPVTWCRLLETLRSFALDRLDERGERHDVEARVVDNVVGRVTRIIEHGAATWSDSARSELVALYENITAAVRWCIANDRDPGRALLLVAVLWGVVHEMHTGEIRTLAEQVLERWPDTDHPMRADAVATAATARYMTGDNDRAIAMAEAALDDAAASPFAPATLRRAIAQARRAAGDTAGGIEWFSATAGEARRLELSGFAVEADAARAQVLADIGRIEDALALVRTARDDAVAVGSGVAATWARTVEGSILLRVDPAAATVVVDEALAECRRIGYAAGTSVNLRTLALGALCRDDLAGAAGHLLALLDELLARGSTLELRAVLEVAAPLLARAGRMAIAADLAATALELPVVSITASVGHELFPLDPAGGSVLPVRGAIVATRAELDAVADPAGAAAAGDGPRASGADGSTATATTTAIPGSPAVAHGSEGAGERPGVFCRTGEFWRIGLGDEVATVRATKGMTDIATLLRAAGREVHCLELMGGAVDERGTGEVLDDAARRAYEQRVRDLQHDLDEAEGANDRGRAERARAELDAVVDELTAALGLGGRTRRSGGSAERARSAVTQRVRATIRRIDDVHPRLGRHLRASVRTGTFCSYLPEEPVHWQL
jgi:predicted ATPase